MKRQSAVKMYPYPENVYHDIRSSSYYTKNEYSKNVRDNIEYIINCSWFDNKLHYRYREIFLSYYKDQLPVKAILDMYNSDTYALTIELIRGIIYAGLDTLYWGYACSKSGDRLINPLYNKKYDYPKNIFYRAATSHIMFTNELYKKLDAYIIDKFGNDDNFKLIEYYYKDQLLITEISDKTGLSYKKIHDYIHDFESDICNADIDGFPHTECDLSFPENLYTIVTCYDNPPMDDRIPYTEKRGENLINCTISMIPDEFLVDACLDHYRDNDDHRDVICMKYGKTIKQYENAYRRCVKKLHDIFIVDCEYKCYEDDQQIKDIITGNSDDNLATIPVFSIGVKYTTANKLYIHGIKTVADLRKATWAEISEYMHGSKELMNTMIMLDNLGISLKLQ